MLLTFVASSLAAQTDPVFRIGEKLSYTLSFGGFEDGGYAETFVASRGKMAGRDAVEVRARFKTIGVVSASFMLVDETRSVFIDPATGLPLFIRRTENKGPIARDTNANFLTIPSSNFDLISMLYKAREMGGNGSYTAFEGEKVFTITFRTSGTRHLRTDAGEFDTNIVSVRSDFLSSRGLREVKLYLSADEQRVPVLFTFKAKKADFTATLSAVSLDQPAVAADPTATPEPIASATPIPIPTPRQPLPPRPYVDNQPLLTELGFELGEKLNYRILMFDQPMASMTFEAVERKMFQEKDSLLLSATVTAVDRPNNLFRPGDSMKVRVDPDTLAPRFSEGKFGPSLGLINQTVTFDPRAGIGFGGAKNVDCAVRHAQFTFTLLRYSVVQSKFQPRP